MLKQQFNVSRLSLAVVSDITYIAADEGWLHLAGVKDLYSKELVGYSMSSRMTADLVVNALAMGIKRRKLGAGLIVHSGRGSQYCSKVYRALLSKHRFVGSMSAKGCCYDNAPIESFWGTLKNKFGVSQTLQNPAGGS